jgi:hypothetical protein
MTATLWDTGLCDYGTNKEAREKGTVSSLGFARPAARIIHTAPRIICFPLRRNSCSTIPSLPASSATRRPSSSAPSASPAQSASCASLLCATGKSRTDAPALPAPPSAALAASPVPVVVALCRCAASSGGDRRPSAVLSHRHWPPLLYTPRLESTTTNTTTTAAAVLSTTDDSTT